MPPSGQDEFRAVLSLPRALRSFTVLLDTEFRQSSMQLDAQRVHTRVFLAAIQQHGESLEYLRYMHRPFNAPARGSLEHVNSGLYSALAAIHRSSPGLSTFGRLHTLHVDHRSSLAECLLDQELAPPNLRTLGLTGLGYDYEVSWRHLPAFVSAIACATPFLHLHLRTRPSGYDISDVAEIFSHRVSRIINIVPLRDALLGVVETLDKSATVKLVCSRQARHLASFHPPFLFGEHMPDEAVIFDSEKPWSKEANLDNRFEVEKYTPEQGDGSGWTGPFSGLGNSFWKE